MWLYVHITFISKSQKVKIITEYDYSIRTEPESACAPIESKPIEREPIESEPIKSEAS